MIIVAGTKRSGTSLWMHALAAAGLPTIGERFPAGWSDLLREANPDGFFESELMGGINFQSNPHPLTGAYLAPEQTRSHAVKVFIPGLVRTDVAFIDRCVATIRDWRDYVASTQRVRALQNGTSIRDEDGGLPPALEWWSSNYGLIRDLAIRGYPVHVVSYASLVRDPTKVVTEVVDWLGHGDARAAAAIVHADDGGGRRSEGSTDAELAAGIEPEHLATFDELYATIDQERALSPQLVERLNQTNESLTPRMLEHRAAVGARAIADVTGHLSQGRVQR